MTDQHGTFLFKPVVLATNPRPTGQKSQPHARQIKSRSGCEPCKRRRVKCDETQPCCRRCQARKETCTGNFQSDTWQTERPWLSAVSHNGQSAPMLPYSSAISTSLSTANSYGEPTGILENDLLRHWFSHVCLTMAIVPPPLNPLSYGMAPYLRQSKALRHTMQCVSQAHRQFFCEGRLAEILEERGRALVSLQNEIDRALKRSPLSQASLLRTILLSSLLLGISSGWMIDDDYGLQYLDGARTVISVLLERGGPTDDFLRYLLGLYIYWEVFSSYIEANHTSATTADLVSRVARQHLAGYVHPVNGFATSICPILIEVGRYYRWVIELSAMAGDPVHELQLEAKLQNWSVEEEFPSSVKSSSSEANNVDQSVLRLLANSQRAMGVIMLYQARSVAQGVHPGDFAPLREAVEIVMTMLQVIPSDSPLLNSVGPLLVIAGSELLESDTEYRALVEYHAAQVTQYTRVRAYFTGFQLVRDIWECRAAGERTTWLELMLEKGKNLSLV
ncbi:hypothetical protein ASPVEDRAFT_42897 [Aspergillus versicolor CBS 583.65]|uniref:Zn(2)-C6 fungal-type domain-containing protein n=1 Tax=Aspergillus versicolor CBS 583.65 TaxID=1036611 RepID=A0A1L9PPD9_ASPVE|nr:uncharacterized protein ASPVEDRAFT_42897 [Aspergillus versicolor CBS 583.65]OJJ03399.1 hypothetical protein ASPVEDRAFT_42897 [Aspergillus versicolor CBS 583.65]